MLGVIKILKHNSVEITLNYIMQRNVNGNSYSTVIIKYARSPRMVRYALDESDSLHDDIELYFKNYNDYIHSEADIKHEHSICICICICIVPV